MYGILKSLPTVFHFVLSCLGPCGKQTVVVSQCRAGPSIAGLWGTCRSVLSGITLRVSCAIAWIYPEDHSLTCCDNSIAPSCLRRSKGQSLNAEVMRHGQSTTTFRGKLYSLETSGTSILFRDTRTHGLH